MKTPFSAIPVIAFLNDMGTEQKLSFEPLPNAKEHIALIYAITAEEIILLRTERDAYKTELLKLYDAAKTPQADELIERVTELFEALKNDTCGECVEMKEFIALHKTLKKYAPPKDQTKI